MQLWPAVEIHNDKIQCERQKFAKKGFLHFGIVQSSQWQLVLNTVHFIYHLFTQVYLQHNSEQIM